MNVGGMSSNNPSWSLFWVVTAPGTVVIVIIILSGKYLWPKRPQNPVSTVATEAKRLALGVEGLNQRRARRTPSTASEV